MRITSTTERVLGHRDICHVTGCNMHLSEASDCISRQAEAPGTFIDLGLANRSLGTPRDRSWEPTTPRCFQEAISKTIMSIFAEFIKSFTSSLLSDRTTYLIGQRNSLERFLGLAVCATAVEFGRKSVPAIQPAQFDDFQKTDPQIHFGLSYMRLAAVVLNAVSPAIYLVEVEAWN